MKQIAIIGSGPAGVSAVLNAQIRQKEYIWFGLGMSKRAAKAELIRNYPGMPNITGRELNEAYLKQLDEMKIELTKEVVTAVMATKTGFIINAGSNVYEAETIIMATGAPLAVLIKGEDEFLGKGVSYCATCDGFFFKNKRIAVYAESDEFTSDINYLREIAKELYVITDTQKITEIQGWERVESITLSGGDTMAVDGVFILRRSIAGQNILPTLETEKGHIKTDKSARTNIPGCFAAGDCTGRPYQYAKAIGEGNIALHSALEYLDMEYLNRK